MSKKNKKIKSSVQKNTELGKDELERISGGKLREERASSLKSSSEKRHQHTGVDKNTDAFARQIKR